MLLRLREPPSPELSQRLLAIARDLQTCLADSVACAPAYQTLMVQFDASRVSRDTVQQHLRAASERANSAQIESREVTLPVCYDRSLALDIEWLADQAGVTTDTVVDLHTSTHYFAYANGFAPGFCYLGDVPEAIAAPRLATPRRQVPAGAVGIADRQTGVYPSPSPGGWRILGRCPLTLFDATATPPNRIAVGDRVKFEPISLSEYQRLGGQP